MTAGEALRGAMDAEGLRVDDVASKTGLSGHTVYRILRDERVSRSTIAVLNLIPGFTERYDAKTRVAS